MQNLAVTWAPILLLPSSQSPTRVAWHTPPFGPFQMQCADCGTCFIISKCTKQLGYGTGTWIRPRAHVAPRIGATQKPASMAFLERASRMLAGDICFAALQKPTGRRARHRVRWSGGTSARAERDVGGRSMDVGGRSMDLYSSCAEVAAPSQSGRRRNVGNGQEEPIDGRA